jgi:photosystem II stability/assembly factor-like uncharacterized protein
MHGLRPCGIASLGSGLRSAHYDEIAWTERRPINDNNYQWWRAAIDADGSNMIVCAWGKRVYTSTDYGQTWTTRRSSDESWCAVATDADGSFLLSAYYGAGHTHYSANGGVNWTECLHGGDPIVNARLLACSGDGQYILAGESGGRLFLSIDSAVSFTEIQPAGAANYNWYCGFVSPSGQYMVAAMNDGVGAGTAWYSDDYGVNWSEIVPCGVGANRNWMVAARASDGSGAYLADNRGSAGTGYVWTAPASGGPWTQRLPGGLDSQDWEAGGSDLTCKHLIVGHESTTIWSSPNGGKVWKQERPKGQTTGKWECIAVSGDGKWCIAGKYNGRLYVGKWF